MFTANVSVKIAIFGHLAKGKAASTFISRHWEGQCGQVGHPSISIWYSTLCSDTVGIWKSCHHPIKKLSCAYILSYKCRCEVRFQVLGCADVWRYGECHDVRGICEAVCRSPGEDGRMFWQEIYRLLCSTEWIIEYLAKWWDVYLIQKWEYTMSPQSQNDIISWLTTSPHTQPMKSPGCT